MSDKRLALFMHGEFGEAHSSAKMVTLEEFIEYRISPHPKFVAMIPKDARTVRFEHHVQDGGSYGGSWGYEVPGFSEEDLFEGVGFVLEVDGKTLHDDVVYEDEDG